MKKFRGFKLLIIGLMCPLLCATIYSQDRTVSSTGTPANPVYQRMQKNKLLSNEELLKGMGFNIYQARLLSSLGYNNTTITNLKKKDVDLVKVLNKAEPRDDKTLAVISDCILIGTVSKVEHTEWDKWFGTTAYVQVEEFIRNDYNLPKGLIPIVIVSTPTKKLIGEDTLGVGEHVFLFLSASSLINFAIDNKNEELLNKVTNDSTIRFRILGKYIIKDSTLFHNKDKKDSKETRDNIKTILNTIHRNITDK